MRRNVENMGIFGEDYSSKEDGRYAFLLPFLEHAFDFQEAAHIVVRDVPIKRVYDFFSLFVFTRSIWANKFVDGLTRS